MRLYTRNLNDVTDRLPGVVELVASLPAHALVLDGEVLGVGDDERPDAFQDTMSRFGRHDGSGGALTVGLLRRAAPRRRGPPSTARSAERLDALDRGGRARGASPTW